MDLLNEIRVFWKSLVVILTPGLLLPFIISFPQQEVRCGCVVLIMAVYWVTGALPLGMTGLLPLILFPLLSLVPVPQLAVNYCKNIHLLILGSMMIALAVEEHGLHRRVALKILTIIGTSPRRLLFGVMVTSWFLSFWLPNVATVAMMIPIVEAIIKELHTAARQKQNHLTSDHKRGGTEKDISSPEKIWDQTNEYDHNHIANGTLQPESELHSNPSCQSMDQCTPLTPHQQLHTSQSNDIPKDENGSQGKSAYLDSMSAMLALGTAYACNIGGTATMIGTNPNMLLHQLLQEEYEKHDHPSPLTYATWIPMGLPGATLALMACFCWLQAYFLRRKCCQATSTDLVEDNEYVKVAIKGQYSALGPISFAEIVAVVWSILITLLFFFRDPGFMSGYKHLFSKPMVTDAVPALFLGILLFVIPSQRPKVMGLRKTTEKAEVVPSMLVWKNVVHKMPWSVMFLIGGAFAIETGSRVCGVSTWLANQLRVLEGLDVWAVMVICMLVVCALTQVTCGMATSALLLPIYLNMAESLGVHPMYLTVPATLVASSTFMLPASSPTNALVYDTGHVPLKQMISCGFVMNVIFLLITFLGTETWIKALFDLNTLPWQPSNATGPS